VVAWRPDTILMALIWTFSRTSLSCATAGTIKLQLQYQLLKYVVFQVKDAAVRIRLVIFGRRHCSSTYYRTDWKGGEERGEGCHPSD
jgi:hypothetical protein